jgi:O-antigen/teichoic acid export membrane protein
VTGAGALVNVLVNFALVPYLGITGAAVATLAAYVVMAGYLYYESNKVYPVPYEWKRIGLLFAVIIAVFAIDRLIIAPLDLSRGLYFGIENALLVCTVVILFVTGFFEKREIDMIKGILRIRAKNEMSMSPQDPVQRSKENNEVTD